MKQLPLNYNPKEKEPYQLAEGRPKNAEIVVFAIYYD